MARIGLPLWTALALVLGTLGPHAAHAACTDPAWLTAAVPDFFRDACDSRNWARVVVSGLPGSNAELEGRRDEVVYQVNDSAKPPTGMAVAQHFRDLFTQMQATIVSAPEAEAQVVAHRPGPDGEVWYLYSAGSGNADERTSFTVTTLTVQALAQQVKAQPLAAAWPSAGCADPGWLVQGLDAYAREGCEARDWAEEDLGHLTTAAKAVEGRRLVVHYSLRDGQAPMTALAIQRNFRAALAAIGATLQTAEDVAGEVVATQTTPAGTVWYVVRDEGGNSDGVVGIGLTTVIELPFVQQAEVRPLDTLPSTETPCADPPWLVKGLPMFHRDGCEARDWEVVELSGLAGEDRQVEGRRLSATFSATDTAHPPPANLVARNFRDALVAAGATVLTRQNDDTAVIAMQTTSIGDVYYLYGNASGNSEGIGGYTLTTVVAQPFLQEVAVRAWGDTPGALPAAGCGDPPWLVKQFASYKRVDCDVADLAPLSVSLPEGDTILAGRVLSANYGLADPHHVRTPASIWRNYTQALQGIGATLVSDPLDRSLAVLHQAGDPSTSRPEIWYIYRSGGGNAQGTDRYSLQTLLVGGPPPGACVLEVYGVNFDFDNATLRPESEPVLQQVLALFQADAGFAAEVGGHTDNIGSAAYNLRLSDTRAGVVKGWLVSHGVAAKRVSSRGYGDTKPLVPNTTDVGRFKNGRVELKRTGCG